MLVSVNRACNGKSGKIILPLLCSSVNYCYCNRMELKVWKPQTAATVALMHCCMTIYTPIIICYVLKAFYYVCFKLMSHTMLRDGNLLMCLLINSSNPRVVGLNTHEGFPITHVPLGKAFNPRLLQRDCFCCKCSAQWNVLHESYMNKWKWRLFVNMFSGA